MRVRKGEAILTLSRSEQVTISHGQGPYRFHPSRAIKAHTTIKNTRLIHRFPLAMAIRLPSNPPARLHTAIGKAYFQITRPAKANHSKAPMFDIPFTNFAAAE